MTKTVLLKPERICRMLHKKYDYWRLKNGRLGVNTLDLTVQTPKGEETIKFDLKDLVDYGDLLMTSHYAIEIIKDEKECVRRATERDHGVPDCKCDRDCLHCDLLHTEEDIEAAYDYAIEGLEADVWIRHYDTPEMAAYALYESIYVEEKDDEKTIRHCFSKKDLRKMAECLLELVENNDRKGNE